MSILVTGAAGFIGSHTVLALLEGGYEVFGIDNFVNAVEGDHDSKPENLKRVSQITGRKLEFAKCDLLNLLELEEIFHNNKFYAVCHLAALKSSAESLQQPLRYYSNNLIGSLNLLNMCKKYDVKNFVFSSSATVYGTPEKLPLTEKSPVGKSIVNVYGQTKFMVEQMLKDLVESDQTWNIITLRYFNPVGAHPSGLIGEDPLGIPNNLMPFIAQVAVGRRPVLKIYGENFDTPDGTGVRDYIHIMDLAKGHVSAFDRMKKVEDLGYEVYNMGTGQGYSVKEMVAAFEKASGKKINIEICEARPGDVASAYCDPSLAIEKLEWKCELGIDEMCMDLWNWQVKNPQGYLKASN